MVMRHVEHSSPIEARFASPCGNLAARRAGQIRVLTSREWPRTSLRDETGSDRTLTLGAQGRVNVREVLM
ncbi:hypothetical protein GCM10010972_34550 [Cellulomonas carbonis]|nr:hypothetical protein GCM10010972_34550 [Cellulomonas carbonis]